MSHFSDMNRQNKSLQAQLQQRRTQGTLSGIESQGSADLASARAGSPALAQQMMGLGGLQNYMAGGMYAPERMATLLGAAPQMQAPSAQSGLGYGRAAMGLANRAAMIQAGGAASQLGGMSPAARAAALAQISQAAAGGVGQAGVQGYQTGLGMLQNTGQSNLQAQLAQMQSRAGLMGQSMGTGAEIGSNIFGTMMSRDLSLEELQQQRDSMRLQYWIEQQRQALQQQQMENEQSGGLGGFLGGLAGSIFGPVGSSVGSAAGNWLFPNRQKSYRS
jgi:hypothetical protein